MDIKGIIASAVVNIIAIIVINSYFFGLKGTATAIILAGLLLGLINRIFHTWFDGIEHKILFSIFFGVFYIALYFIGIQIIFDRVPGIYSGFYWRLGVSFALYIINIIANIVIDNTLE